MRFHVEGPSDLYDRSVSTESDGPVCAAQEFDDDEE
jgi:hypothetical protein